MSLGFSLVLSKGEYLAYIIGAPEFVNRGFTGAFPGGIPPPTPLIAAGS